MVLMSIKYVHTSYVSRQCQTHSASSIDLIIFNSIISSHFLFSFLKNFLFCVGA